MRSLSTKVNRHYIWKKVSFKYKMIGLSAYLADQYETYVASSGGNEFVYGLSSTNSSILLRLSDRYTG